MTFGAPIAHFRETGKDSWSGEIDSDSLPFEFSCSSRSRFRGSRPIPRTWYRFAVCTFSAAFRCRSRILASDFSEQEVAVCSPFGQQLKMGSGNDHRPFVASRIWFAVAAACRSEMRGAFLPGAIERRAHPERATLHISLSPGLLRIKRKAATRFWSSASVSMWQPGRIPLRWLTGFQPPGGWNVAYADLP